MQASKSISPSSKKSQSSEKDTSLVNNANSNNNNNNNNNIINTNNTKSVAQRVMDVAAQANQKGASVTSCKPKEGSSSTNSIEIDQEIEDIINTASKLEVTSNSSNTNSATSNNQSTISTGDLNNSTHNNLNQHYSPTFIFQSNRAAGNSNSFTSVPKTMASFINGDPIFKQVVSKSQTIEQSDPLFSLEPNSLNFQDASISLDTKIPHPYKSDQFNTKNDNEEVSYYNEQQLQDSATKHQLNVKKMESNKANISDSKMSHDKLQVIVPKTQSYKDDSLNEFQFNEEGHYDAHYDIVIMDNDSSNNELNFNNLQTNQHNVTTGPKAKSAPATPCNITPTAFHQNTSHLLNPSPANTLPPDIRKNISATCRVLPGSVSSHPVNEYHLNELIKQGETLLDSKDYFGAIRSFSKCIELATSGHNLPYLKKNFKVYSQRAEAHFNLGNYNEAIDDSMAARELNPKWTQAYYRQGRSQFLIGQYAAALAVFSFGLAQDPTNKRLFEALVDAAIKSSFLPDFEVKYDKLKSLELDTKPFIVVSVIGQELLAKRHGEHAAIILESALKLGPDNKRLKSSVLSTISYAYCSLGDSDKAIAYMQKELDLENELEDINGQCRVLSNLGYTYYKMRNFDKSLEAHRKQLNLAMRTHLFQQASVALNAIGHVHAARNDFTSALTSHTRCLEILKQLGDNDYNQYRELLSIGHIHCMLNDYKAADDKYNEAIQLLENSNKISQDDYQIGLIMVNFNLAYLALKKQSLTEAKKYYSSVIKLAQRIPNPKRVLFEMRASNGMGQAHRLFKRFDEAREWFEKQLHLAELLDDREGQSQALCNLGMVYQHFKDYNNAWKMFDSNMQLVGKDPLLKAYAHSYMGSIYFLMNRYNEAQAHYETSLNTFKELNYCSAEKKTIDLNMASVNERMGHSEMSTDTNQQKKVVVT